MALLGADVVGAELHIVVEVTMERDRASLYRRFEERVLAASEVRQCYVVTGECDFVLIVSVPDMDAYDRFCDAAPDASWARALEALPGCLIVALVASSLPRGGPAEWIAGAVAAAVADVTRSLPLTMVVGVLAAFVLRRAM